MPFTTEALTAKLRELLGTEPSVRIILVVDDEEEVRCLLREILEEERYEVLEAASGSAALELTRTRNVDLIITDMMMSEGDGFEMIAALRKSQPEVKIIGMSGALSSGAVGDRELQRLGAHATLAKPFRLDVVVREVKKLLHSWS